MNDLISNPLVWGIAGIALVAFLFSRRRGSNPAPSKSAGEMIRLEGALSAFGEAKIQYKGMTVTIVNETRLDLEPGRVVRIDKIENGKLFVQPK